MRQLDADPDTSRRHVLFTGAATAAAICFAPRYLKAEDKGRAYELIKFQL
jgi:hypothetical protein